MGIKIYVANLGKYNEGELVGQWFTLPVDVEDIKEAVGVADGTDYEEMAIHDYESSLRIGEYDNIDKLNEIAEAMEDMSDTDIEAVSCLVDDGVAKDFIEGIDKLEDCMFYHNCSNMGDVAYQWHEETGTDMDAPLMNYVDWDRVGRDFDLEGTFYELAGEVFMQYIG